MSDISDTILPPSSRAMHTWKYSRRQLVTA